MSITYIFEETANATDATKSTLIEIIDSIIESYYAECKVNSTTSSKQEDVKQ